MSTMIIENVSIAGIPCQAEIDTWPSEPMTHDYPGCDAGWELCQVLDRKGYPAEWLERKLEDPKVQAAFEESVDVALDAESKAQENLYWDLKYEEQRNREFC